VFVSTVGIVAFGCAMLSMAIFPSQSLLAGLREALATSVITSVALSAVGLPLLARIQRRALDAEKAIDSTDDGYWVLDNHGNFIDVNDAYCRMMGYDRSRLIALCIADLESVATQAQIQKQIARIIGTGQERFETRHRHQAGHWVDLEITVTAINAHRLVAFLRDITERKRVEQALRQAKGMAESASLAKTQFLTTMSHELRTPMSGILGMAQLLMTPELSTPDRLEYTRTVLDSGQVLLSLLNDILDLSRIEAGRLELKESVVSPERLCQDIAALFAASARRKQLQVNCRWQGPTGQSYLGDSVRLRQMLSNLVSNAVKFTDEGQIDIQAREVERVDGQATLEFAITDTGIGIEAGNIALLFQPFSQLDTSNTRRHGGSGLGLSIVQNLALLMGGTVGVEARPGEGSRFWFRVRATPTTDLALEDTGRHRPVAPVSATASGYRVMVVEDNPMVRKVVEAMLTKSHLHISAYANGQEALAALTDGADPQIVLMDCHMPIMDGFAATVAIRAWERAQSRPRVPIVALTAGAFEQDREKCIAAGMDDFLPKPVALADLLHVVETWARVRSPA